MLKNNDEVRESYGLWQGIINLDFGKMQFSHWAISQLIIELIQPVKPPARTGMFFAPLASLVQGRGQAAQALVLHSWGVEWGIFFLLHLRPAWAVSEWQKFPAAVARGALNHSISVLCEWNLLARAAGHRHITFPYLCQKRCLVHIMCLVAKESQASRKSSQKKKKRHLQS